MNILLIDWGILVFHYISNSLVGDHRYSVFYENCEISQSTATHISRLHVAERDHQSFQRYIIERLL